jgi:hypothetical protein
MFQFGFNDLRASVIDYTTSKLKRFRETAAASRDTEDPNLTAEFQAYRRNADGSPLLGWNDPPSTATFTAGALGAGQGGAAGGGRG